MKNNPSILMVCLGNICRSPMAEGILRNILKERKLETFIDSAGTGGWHAGENPDVRAIKTMHQYGIDISNLVARQFRKNDFDQFDYIFAMDESNLEDIISLTNNQDQIKKVQLILKFHPDWKDGLRSVPDPWYGGEQGFTDVYYMLQEACTEIANTYFD